MSWGTTISPNWENIIILSQEFPHYRKIFHVGLAQGCAFASALLPLTLLYTSVGSQGCLQLFTCDGFSTPALSSPHVALCSTQLFLSPFFLLYFPFPLIFTPCLPSFHASNLSSSLAPHHHHHHYHLFTSLPILRYQSLLGPDKLRVCLSSFSRLLLPALPNLAPPSISPTTQSPLMSEKPVGIQVLLLIIAFTGIPHCLALPWGGKEGRVWKNERDNRVKLCQGWHAHQLASARSGEQNWHMQLSAMRSK